MIFSLSPLDTSAKLFADALFFTVAVVVVVVAVAVSGGFIFQPMKSDRVKVVGVSAELEASSSRSGEGEEIIDDCSVMVSAWDGSCAKESV